MCIIEATRLSMGDRLRSQPAPQTSLIEHAGMRVLARLEAMLGSARR